MNFDQNACSYLAWSCAAQLHIQLLPVAVLEHQRCQCSLGSCFCQSGGELSVLPQNIICPLVCSDSKLPAGEVLTWRLSAMFYSLQLMCNFSCRPSWPDITYCFQKKYVRHKQEAWLCSLLYQWQNWSSRVVQVWVWFGHVFMGRQTKTFKCMLTEEWTCHIST